MTLAPLFPSLRPPESHHTVARLQQRDMGYQTHEVHSSAYLAPSSAQDHRRAQALSLTRAIVPTTQMRYVWHSLDLLRPWSESWADFRYVDACATDLGLLAWQTPLRKIQFVDRCVTTRRRDDGMARWGLRRESVTGRPERYRADVARKLADYGDLCQICALAWSGMWAFLWRHLATSAQFWVGGCGQMPADPARRDFHWGLWTPKVG
ncbi:hypothetical protein C8F04DRAFT_1189421 [Mycena alexandri]|uniref:Uncharacterized protein n=1 Tax=Mycena alexandri TaxID=1745969 RepID=A0AAD6SGL0_9AGAR|nr:hypothetical protein C8F04DRAFT_1189421 [Mycena alexandri]